MTTVPLLASLSIAMATCNGERFVGEQINSILSQEFPVSEIVISDDASTDKTLEIVSEIASKSQIKIKVLTSSVRKGVHYNFRKAITATSGDIIFLADQDDFWLPHKTRLVCETLENCQMTLVIHDSSICDEHLNLVFESSQHRYDILRIPDQRSPGCCMAFTKDLIPFIADLPPDLPHDHCIRLIASRIGEVKRIEPTLILYRRHGNNSSGWLPDSLKEINIVRRTLFAFRLAANSVLSSMSLGSSRRSNIEQIDSRVKDVLSFRNGPF